MDEQRRVIDALFDAALDIPRSERAAFLEKETSDEEVRGAVKRLLSASDETALMDESPWQGSLGDQMAADFRLNPAEDGERIGPYCVVRELGRGGMASVYLAQRADGHFEQEVALKLATTVAPDQGAILRRFHVERQILASLDHPNIARLVDGGLTEDGRPYFAMELIDGTPIDRYCDDQRLPIRDRVRLMADAALAVEAAHRALVVHRDIKPSNVLVTRNGLVKLLDFGIAKSVAEGDSPDLTRTATPMMTPEYASPEQFRGDLVTTASDVYQLGLLLYQLLTGERPYTLSGLAPTQAEKLVCETAPERPSTRLSRMTRSGSAAIDDISSRRQARPAELRRLLAGDLDTIVMKALRKEKDRRYRSAAELADDLESFLDGRPIRARGDSPVYLLQKFLQRHAAAATAAALAILTIFGVTAFYTVELGRERNAARLEATRAAEARDEAQAARLEAEQTTQFLVDLFQQSDPWKSAGAGGETGGEGLSARQLLDLGADKLRLELADQPLTQARLMDTIGGVYRRLSLYEEAEELLEEAFELRRRHGGAESLELAESFYNLGYLRYDLAQVEEAEELFAKAVALREAHQGPRAPELGPVINAQATVARRQGRLEDAEELLRRVIDIETEHFGIDDVRTNRGRGNLANLFHFQGRHRESIELFEEVLAVERRELGAEHVTVSTTLNNLANAYDGLGEKEKALELLVEAVAIKEKALGPDHPLVASSLVNLGPALRDAGRPQEAKATLERAAAIIAPKAPDHPGLGNVYTNLASLFLEDEDFEQTERYFELAFEHRVRTLGPGHTNVGAAHYNFGELYLRQERVHEAQSAFDRALEIWRKNLNEDHPYLGFGYTAAAETQQRLGRHGEALASFERAYEILSVKVGKKHEMLHRAGSGYAQALERAGRKAEAEAVRAFLEES